MKNESDRHVPLGTLLNSRWGMAEEWKFGKGASVYDECLILGDVTVGENCWIGPFTVLDEVGKIGNERLDFDWDWVTYIHMIQ